VVGGALAAEVVFAGEVDARTVADPRVRELEAQLRTVSDASRAGLATELAATRTAVRAEKLAEVAAEFDGVHSIHRAVEVGSVDRVISAADLRPAIIEALGGGVRG